MFKNTFQGGPCVELLTCQGSGDCLSLGNGASWKLSNKSLVKKMYQKDLKGFCFVCDRHSRMSFPQTEKVSAFLLQPILVLQLFVPASFDSFTIELLISDMDLNHRRFFLSSNLKEPKVTALHTLLPLPASMKRNLWMNVCIDLSALASQYFHGSSFRCLNSFSITGSFKLRKAFTLKAAPTLLSVRYWDETTHNRQSAIDPIPRAVQFPVGVPHETVMLDFADQRPALLSRRNSTSSLQEHLPALAGATKRSTKKLGPLQKEHRLSASSARSNEQSRLPVLASKPAIHVKSAEDGSSKKASELTSVTFLPRIKDMTSSAINQTKTYSPSDYADPLPSLASAQASELTSDHSQRLSQWVNSIENKVNPAGNILSNSMVHETNPPRVPCVNERDYSKVIPWRHTLGKSSVEYVAVKLAEETAEAVALNEEHTESHKAEIIDANIAAHAPSPASPAPLEKQGSLNSLSILLDSISKLEVTEPESLPFLPKSSPSAIAPRPPSPEFTPRFQRSRRLRENIRTPPNSCVEVFDDKSGIIKKRNEMTAVDSSTRIIAESIALINASSEASEDSELEDDGKSTYIGHSVVKPVVIRSRSSSPASSIPPSRTPLLELSARLPDQQKEDEDSEEASGDSSTDDDSVELELEFDSKANCYFDPKTGRYYNIDDSSDSDSSSSS